MSDTRFYRLLSDHTLTQLLLLTVLVHLEDGWFRWVYVGLAVVFVLVYFLQLSAAKHAREDAL